MSTPLTLVKRMKTNKPKAAIGDKGKLSVGTHTVVIDKILMQDYATKGSLDVAIEDTTGASHRERIWPIDKADQSAFSRTFVGFVNAVFNTPEIYPIIEQAAGNPDMESMFFRAFEGCKLQAVIEKAPGVDIEKYSDGWVLREYPSMAVWEDDNGPVVFTAFREASEVLRAEGLRRTYPRVALWNPCSDAVCDANYELFVRNIKDMEETAKQLGNPRFLFNPSVFSD